MSKMTAYIKEVAGPGFKKVEKDIPKDIKEDEVLIKVLATSICGTDVHIYEWDRWSAGRVKPPLTVGHEFSGRVIEVGSAVKDYKVGDIVSAETHIVCHTCEFCLRGEYHICENTKIIGVDTDGCFAEYIKMPAFNLIKDESGVEPKYLSIQEPLGNAVHTMMKYPIKDKDVVILGCGPIGLMGVDLARALGAKKIIAIEVNDYRINLAKELGADVVINPLKEDVVARVLEETNNRGADVVAEYSGKKDAIEKAFKYIKYGGKMSMLGLGDQNIDIDFSNDIVFRGIEIYGVVGRLMFETWDQIAEFLKNKQLNLEKIITHFYKFEDMEEAMAKMRSGNSGKVVLLMEE